MSLQRELAFLPLFNLFIFSWVLLNMEAVQFTSWFDFLFTWAGPVSPPYFWTPSGSLCAAFLPPLRRAALHNRTIVVLSDNKIWILLNTVYVGLLSLRQTCTDVTANLSLKCGRELTLESKVKPLFEVNIQTDLVPYRLAPYSTAFMGLRGRSVFSFLFLFFSPSGFVSQTVKLTISLKRLLKIFFNLQNSWESELAIMTSNGRNSRRFAGGTLWELSFTSISNALVALTAVSVLVIIILIEFSE